MIDKKLLDILVCPVTKGKLFYSQNSNELISISAKLAYKIVDHIPVMLESEARLIGNEEYDNYKKIYS